MRPPPSGSRRAVGEHRAEPEVPRSLLLAGAIAWRLIAVAVAIYILGIVLARLRIVILPLLLALVLASVLQPLVNGLKDRRLPPLVATWMAILGGLVVIVGLLTFAVMRVVDEAEEIGRSLQEGWGQLLDRVATLPFFTRTDVEDLLGRALEGIGEEGVGLFVTGAATAFEALIMVVLTVVFAFFLVKDGARLSALFLDSSPPTAGATWMRWGAAPLIVPIMVITFFGSFIPFVGPWVAGVTATLVALATLRLVDAAIVAAAFFAIQQLEGNVLEPVVLGRVMEMHPVVILAGVTGGGLVAGLPGAFLAVPLVAVLTAVYEYVREGRGGTPVAAGR